jgi:hypothetical protein
MRDKPNNYPLRLQIHSRPSQIIHSMLNPDGAFIHRLIVSHPSRTLCTMLVSRTTACCVGVRQGRVMYPDGFVGEMKISHGEMLLPILRA